MGVKGLQSYIESNHSCLKSVNIIKCAQKYVLRTLRRPILLIDGSSSYYSLYNCIEGKNKYLGMFEEYAQIISVFINKLANAGVRVIIYFDGSPTEEREKLWINRRCKDGIEIEKAISFLDQNQVNKAKPILMNYLCIGDFVKYIFILNKCEIIQTVEEADDEILDFITNNGCFGVLAQDTDFIIAEGVTNYFSANFLDPLQLTTKAYIRYEISRILGIDEHFLPIFASLSGNDKLSDEQLRKFHLSLLRDHKDYSKFMTISYLPKKELFPRIGHFIQRLSPYINNLENCSSVICNNIGMPHLESTIKQSILSYVPSTIKKVSSKKSVFSNNCNNWLKIISVAEDRHRKGVHRAIFSIVTRLKFYQPCGVEMFGNVTYPASGILLEKLRRKMYGILLKEHPSNKDTVMEYIAITKDSVSKPVPVKACYPLFHPGLLKLWKNRESQVDNLRMLCWAVSEKLDIMRVLIIQEPYRIASLALYYLVNEVKSGFTRFHVETLLTSLFCHPELTRKVNLTDCRGPDKLQVHIASVYTQTWFSMLMVGQACGNFYGFEDKMKIFDGVMFNYCYNLKLAISDVVKPSDQVIYKTMLKFIFNKK